MEILVCLIFAFLSVSHGQVVKPGKCPDVRGVKNFNPSTYAGKWFEWERFTSVTEKGAKCNTIEFAFGSNKHVDVTFSSTLANGTAFHTVGKGTLGSIDASFNTTFVDFGNNRMIYVILGTDYKNWATMFACRSVSNTQHQLYLWILTKNLNQAAAHINKGKEAATSQKISTDPLEFVQHKICPRS